MPAVNSKIVQADYNDIRNKIVAVLGNGSGNSGYGQQDRINSVAVAEGQKVTINEWANLRFDIINAYKHINGVNPTTAQVAEGNTIRYTSSFTPDTGTLDVPQKQYDDWANNITTTRFIVAAGESGTTAAVSQSRTGSWITQSSCTVTFSFSTANAARYFFNSGGQIRISSSRSGGVTSNQNTAWTSLLSSAGTQSFGGNKPDKTMIWLELLLILFGGVIVAIIAQHRGRNVYGWFFLGVFFFCLAFILVLVLPDLKEQNEREQRLLDENRRLKEQVRKDRMIADQRDLQVRQRLDAHDNALSMDTSNAVSHVQPRELAEEQRRPEPLDPGACQWWYFEGEMRHGPRSFTQLRTLWQQGVIHRSTRVWTMGMPDWATIEVLPHLLEALGD